MLLCVSAFFSAKHKKSLGKNVKEWKGEEEKKKRKSCDNAQQQQNIIINHLSRY